MSVRSKFGASEMRLNMLDPCLPLEYPLNVYVDVFDARQAAEYEELASLAESGEWEAVLRYVEDHHHLINTSRLRRRPAAGQEEEAEEQRKTFLWTVLHWAASCESAGETSERVTETDQCCMLQTASSSSNCYISELSSHSRLAWVKLLTTLRLERADLLTYWPCWRSPATSQRIKKLLRILRKLCTRS